MFLFTIDFVHFAIQKNYTHTNKQTNKQTRDKVHYLNSTNHTQKPSQRPPWIFLVYLKSTLQSIKNPQGILKNNYWVSIMDLKKKQTKNLSAILTESSAMGLYHNRAHAWLCRGPLILLKHTASGFTLHKSVTPSSPPKTFTKTYHRWSRWQR